MNEFLTDKDFKEKGFRGDKNREGVEGLIKLAVKLLYSMLEANRDEEMAEYLAAHLDFDYMLKMLEIEFRFMMKDAKLTEDQLLSTDVEELNNILNCPIFEERIMEAFDIYFLLVTLNELT